MLGVKVTYAHKRRRVQNARKKLPSSPLEVLPPDVDDLTCTQMARRMLKRSRRIALAEQLDDKNVEHFREHLAKRIKRTQERAEASVDVSQDDSLFQTPFPSSQSVHESAITKPPAPDQLSPVPVARRIASRTSSRSLKENSTHLQVLASPFSSRPASAAPSPKHKVKGRSSHQVPRLSIHTKSRTLSGVFKENARRILRKDSTVSLKDAVRNKEPSARHIKHQRYPSSPSTAYMRSRFAQEDWISPPKLFSRAFGDCNADSVHSSTSFYADQPQSYSTPAVSRLRNSPDLHRPQAKAVDYRAFSRRDDPGSSDVEMVDDTALLQRQTVHLSGNSIFSSSDEFTIGSTHNDKTTNNVTGAKTRVSRQVPSRRHALESSQEDNSLARSYVAEYTVPLFDLDRSPASTAATEMRVPEGVPKLSVGAQLFALPGTSPAHGGNLVRKARARSRGARSSVGEQLIGLPGTSPVHGESLVIRSFKNSTKTPPPSPSDTNAPGPPSSPDLTLGLQSLEICGNAHTRSDGKTQQPSVSVAPQARSHFLQNASAESSIKKPVKPQVVRNRAGTIRASDKPCVHLGTASGMTVPPPSNIRRTRSGTVVGPGSTLAAKGTRLTKGPRATRLAAVQPGSESESDDELLLKGFWTEGLEYLGRRATPQDVEADELNLGGPLHSLDPGPSYRPGIRRR